MRESKSRSRLFILLASPLPTDTEQQESTVKGNEKYIFPLPPFLQFLRSRPNVDWAGESHRCHFAFTGTSDHGFALAVYQNPWGITIAVKIFMTWQSTGKDGGRVSVMVSFNFVEIILWECTGLFGGCMSITRLTSCQREQFSPNFFPLVWEWLCSGSLWECPEEKGRKVIS